MQHTKQLQHTIIFHYSERSAPQEKRLAPNEAFYLSKPNTDLANSPTNVLAHLETRLLHQVLAILCQLSTDSLYTPPFSYAFKIQLTLQGGDATTMNIINCERTTTVPTQAERPTHKRSLPLSHHEFHNTNLYINIMYHN